MPRSLPGADPGLSAHLCLRQGRSPLPRAVPHAPLAGPRAHLSPLLDWEVLPNHLTGAPCVRLPFSFSFLHFPFHSHSVKVRSLIILSFSLLPGLLPFFSPTSLSVPSTPSPFALGISTPPRLLFSEPQASQFDCAARLPRNCGLGLPAGPFRSQGPPTQHCSGLPPPLKDTPRGLCGPEAPTRGTLASGAAQLSGTTGLF